MLPPRAWCDGGFATPEIFDFLDAEPRLDYVVAVAKNAVLKRAAEPAMTTVRAQSAASGQTEHVYTDVSYAAASWDAPRRVLVKAEVVHLAGREPQDNPRFVVTNLRQTPRFLYERIYCAALPPVLRRSCPYQPLARNILTTRRSLPPAIRDPRRLRPRSRCDSPPLAPGIRTFVNNAG